MSEGKVGASPSKERAEYSDLLKKILTALFYGVSSFMIMVVNKTVLTRYQFPSFQVLGIGQMIATVIILNIGRLFKIIQFPDLTSDTFRKIWPLPLMYLGNMVFGLGGTQNLSLPMMTVLRRFSILMTMIGSELFYKIILKILHIPLRRVLYTESEAVHPSTDVGVSHDSGLNSSSQ